MAPLHHHHAGDHGFPLILGALMVVSVLYLAGVLRRGTGARPGLDALRAASWCAGAGLLVWAMTPRLLPFEDGGLRQHMVQHLLMGMAAPLGLVMAAPVTVLLRNLRAPAARRVVRVLGSLPVRMLTHPLTALTLNLGGMAALYFTPLYILMARSEGWHLFVHAHFIAAGCLYVWVIAGPDPAPGRPSVPARLAILGLAILFHSVMAQMLYAGIGIAFAAPDRELQQAAELMYYGGDVTELLLAFAMVSGWRPRPPRRAETVVKALAPQS